MCPEADPAALRVIQVHESPGEQRVALLEAGRLAEFWIDRPGAPDGLGDVHIGRVIARVPAMAGSFVALHDAEAFLPDSDAAAGLTEGCWAALRITRAGQGGKGPRVTANGVDAGAAVEGPARLLAPGPTALEALRKVWPEAPVEFRPFTDALEAEIDALSVPEAVLSGGLRALFAVTPALTAIDLDGAGTTAGRARKADAQMGANLAALPDLVRQIVLRNYAGAILVDFAGVATRKRRGLLPALQTALQADRLAPRLAGLSPLGFAEIERRRLRPPLHEKLTSAHGLGMAALRQASAEVRAAPSRRLVLRASPVIVAALQADAAALAALAREAAYPLVLRADASLVRTWLLEQHQSGESL